MTARQQFWFWGVVAILVAALLYLFNEVLLAFVTGFAVAYFFDPLADRLEALKVPRSLASGLIIVGFFLLVFLFLMMLYPLLAQEFGNLMQNLPGYWRGLKQFVGEALLLAGSSDADVGGINVRDLTGGIQEAMAEWAAGLGKRLISGGLAIFNLLSFILLAPVVAYYLLRDWDHIVAWFDGLLPRDHAPVIREQFSRIDQALAGFVRGQALVSLAMAVLFAIGWGLVGLKYSLALAMLVGLLAFIPYAGTVFGGLLTLAVAVGQFLPYDPLRFGLVAAVFVAVQIIESSFLTPKLVGSRIGLHPVWVLFAILAGGNLMGLTGVLVAVPIAAIIGVLVRFAIERYRSSRAFHGGKQHTPVAASSADPAVDA